MSLTHAGHPQRADRPTPFRQPPGPSHERADAEDAVFEVPGLDEESVFADEALREDRALNNPRPR
jgi:hypothetical protein